MENRKRKFGRAYSCKALRSSVGIFNWLFNYKLTHTLDYPKICRIYNPCMCYCDRNN